MVGDIFERDEDRRTHQELAEQKRRRARLFLQPERALRGPCAGFLFVRYLLD